MASICPSEHHSAMDGTTSDEPDTTNRDSLLVVADNNGRLSLYQDGTFPLGRVKVGDALVLRSLHRTIPSPSTLRTYVATSLDGVEATPLCAVQVDLPLLRHRFSRELSHLSSAARDLTWYAMRVVKEMRSIWFGSETNTGAREWGPRWVRSLETKQKEQYGRMLP